MQLHLPALFILLGSALSLPTSTDSNSTAPSILEKRFHYGWIGSFASNDCHGKNMGPRPQLQDYNTCYKFTSPKEANHIGINFGTGWYQFDTVNFFLDDDCKILANKRGPSGYYHQKEGKDGYGCTAEYRGVRSVMAHGRV